ncbi:MAG: hypothetical protein HN494_17605, partial [Opitutae bacterium]|nr:hypothetical protein [Opitutae bacterium]
MTQLFSVDERHSAENLSSLLVCNPFTSKRQELERAILGDNYENPSTPNAGEHSLRLFSPNLVKLGAAEKLADKARETILQRKSKGKLPARDFALYRDLAFLALFDEVRDYF